ncbi:nitroreductase [Acetobacter sp. CAG:977]|nr:nitroreductase [Acetobacter sp. CAG:977]
MRLCVAVMASLFMTFDAFAQEAVKLPAPDLTGGMPLMQAMKERKTERAFSTEALDNQTLSDMLWAAWGYNRPDKRTIPTARNRQNMEVYVLKADGAFRYDARANSLIPVTAQDLRPLAAKQDFVLNAPVTLLFVADEDDKYAGMHAGSAYQNVGLYCASKGLYNVVRGMIDRDALAKALGIEDEDDIIISQTVGKPAK